MLGPGQQLESFVPLKLTTKSDRVKYFGGGTSNIGFLQGTDAEMDIAVAKTKPGPPPTNTPPADPNALGNVGNAFPIEMTVTYWIETISQEVTVQPSATAQQIAIPTTPKGVLGPVFNFAPTTGAGVRNPITAPTKTRVQWTQIQYSQNVILNFNGLSWPHISVATLGDTSLIPWVLPT
jgi:hypothetical protein